MALTQLEQSTHGNQILPLALQRSKARAFADQTKAALKLVPDLNTDNSRAVSKRTFIGFLIGVFTAGLLILLSVNTALTSGAFTLENMKLQLAAVNDERDAVLNQVATYSSPDNLAKVATKLGMQPQAAINFLNLDGGSSK